MSFLLIPEKERNKPSKVVVDQPPLVTSVHIFFIISQSSFLLHNEIGLNHSLSSLQGTCFKSASLSGNPRNLPWKPHTLQRFLRLVVGCVLMLWRGHSCQGHLTYPSRIPWRKMFNLANSSTPSNSKTPTLLAQPSTFQLWSQGALRHLPRLPARL